MNVNEIQTWKNIQGIATYGKYEVRVTERLPSTSRPIRWAVFAKVSGTSVRITPLGKDFRSFADAKLMVERMTEVIQELREQGVVQ